MTKTRWFEGDVSGGLSYALSDLIFAPGATIAGDFRIKNADSLFAVCLDGITVDGSIDCDPTICDDSFVDGGACFVPDECPDNCAGRLSNAERYFNVNVNVECREGSNVLNVHNAICSMCIFSLQVLGIP